MDYATSVNMGALCEERSEKDRGGRKVERNDQQQGPMETNYQPSRTASGMTTRPASPMQKGNQRTHQNQNRNRFCYFVYIIIHVNVAHNI